MFDKWISDASVWGLCVFPFHFGATAHSHAWRVAIPDTFAVSFVCSIVVNQQSPRKNSHQVLTDQFIPVTGGFDVLKFSEVEPRQPFVMKYVCDHSWEHVLVVPKCGADLYNASLQVYSTARSLKKSDVMMCPKRGILNACKQNIHRKQPDFASSMCLPRMPNVCTAKLALTLWTQVIPNWTSMV